MTVDALPPVAAPPVAPPPVAPPMPIPTPTPPAARRSWLPLLIAVLVTAVGLTLVIAVTRPGGEPSASPPGQPSTSATNTRTSTPTATETDPTGYPSTSASTLPGGTVLGQMCSSSENGYTLRYPDGWHAELAFAGWKCALFDPRPFTVTPNSEVPPVTVVISVGQFTYNSAVAQYTDPGSYQLVSQSPLAIVGHQAVAVEIVTISDTMPLPQGTSRYAILVEWGTSTLIIETNSVDAADYAIAKHVVRGMAESMTAT